MKVGGVNHGFIGWEMVSDCRAGEVKGFVVREVVGKRTRVKPGLEWVVGKGLWRQEEVSDLRNSYGACVKVKGDKFCYGGSGVAEWVKKCFGMVMEKGL